MRYFDNLREANLARVTAFGHTLEGWTPAMWGCALAGETGELCNLLKKQFRMKPGDDVSQQEVADEIADVAIYLDLLAARMGMDVQVCVINKFNRKSEEVGSDIRLSGTVTL